MAESQEVADGSNREFYERMNALLDNKLDLSSVFMNKGNENKSSDFREDSYIESIWRQNEIESKIHPSALKGKTTNLARVRSVSFSTPEIQEGFSRIMNGGGGILNSAGSPTRMRPHASESGSPTLEQALIMGRLPGRLSPGSDAGYGSYQSGATEFTGLAELSGVTEHTNSDDSLSPPPRTLDRSISLGERRPTLTQLAELDIAVAHAVQNLQNLQNLSKDSKAALLSGTGIVGKMGRVENTGMLPFLQNKEITGNEPGPDGGFEKDMLFDCLVRTREPRERHIYDRSCGRDPLALERAARQYRSAAAIHDASCTWSGQLPPRQSTGRQPSYSSKIFLGGVPWDITESSLIQAFAEFGSVRVEWPGRDSTSPPRGYLYLIFEDEDRVKELLAHCTSDYNQAGSCYFKISSRKMRAKEVQIIPWLVADSNYVRYPSPRLDPQKTVFVGALHGMINAQSLALIFNDLFGGVVYAGLDTDKHKYPIGSGRVTFNNPKSYMKAVSAAFIEIKTPRFTKKVQVDPYLEDALCSVCCVKQGPYFCRDLGCFNYYCRGCWDQQHSHSLAQHKPLMRNIRGLTRARLQDVLNPIYFDDYNNNQTALIHNSKSESRDSKSLLDFWNSRQNNCTQDDKEEGGLGSGCRNLSRGNSLGYAEVGVGSDCRSSSRGNSLGYAEVGVGSDCRSSSRGNNLGYSDLSWRPTSLERSGNMELHNESIDGLGFSMAEKNYDWRSGLEKGSMATSPHRNYEISRQSTEIDIFADSHKSELAKIAKHRSEFDKLAAQLAETTLNMKGEENTFLKSLRPVLGREYNL